MPDMFGFTGGFIEGQHAADVHTLATLGAQEEKIKIEQGQIALAQQKEFLSRLKNMSPAGGGGGANDPRSVTDTLASNLQNLASMAIASGLTEQGKGYAVAASTLTKNQAQIEKYEFERGMKNLQLIDKLLPSIHDEASWKQANMIFQMESGHPSPFANVPFSPELMDKLKTASQTAKDRALTLAAEARARADDAKAREADLRTKVLIPTQAKLNEDRDKALIKSGGKDLIPKAGDLKVITDLATSAFDIDATDPKQMADIRVQARPIAERMKEIMKENPGLSQSEAGKRAFNEAQKRGDFAGLDRNKNLPGGSPKTAIALPKDKSKAKDNHWYTVNGKPMYLDGGTLYTEAEVKANEADLEDEGSDEEDEGED